MLMVEVVLMAIMAVVSSALVYVVLKDWLAMSRFQDSV